jgi:hypothetical protein
MDAPAISPTYSVFDSGPQAVTITSDDPSATIRFTIDGSDPNDTSTLYTGSFDISVSTIVKAIAIDIDISPITTSYIQIDATTSGVSRDALIVWLKADNGAITSSSNVTNWIDVSGSGNDASQSDSSSQPGYISSAVNDLPAVDFSGSGQFLQFPSGFADFTSGASIFVVIEPTGFTGEYAGLLNFGNNSNASSIIWCELSSTSNAFYVCDSSSDLSSLVSTDFTQEVYQLIEAVHDGTSTATLYTNGNQSAENTSMFAIDNTTRSGNYVGRYSASGGEFYFEGQIAELLIYNRGVSDSERQAVEVYLSQRYGLPPVAPTISPSYSVFDSGPQTVTITSDDPSATIFFTTDNSEPTPSSPEYDSPFDISSSTVVKAIAVNSSTSSPVAKSYIQIDPDSTTVPRSGMIVWLKADNGVITDSSNVTAWVDVSGSGINASQSVSSNQPTYVSEIINDLPAVNFNGSAQFLRFPSGFADFTDGMSIFIVLEPTGFTTADARIVDFGDSSNLNSDVTLCQPTSESFGLYIANSSGGQTSVISNGIAQDSYQLIEVIFDGSSTATLFTGGVEGAQNISLYSIDNISRSGNYIGQSTAGGAYFEGQIAEILIYNTALSDEERQGVESYISLRYNLPVLAAPIINPGYSVFAAPPQAVTITSEDEGANIYYTIDGSEPSPTSIPYAGSFDITSSTTVKAMSTSTNGTSYISTAFIQLDANSANVSRNGLITWLKSDNGLMTSSSQVTAWMDLSGNENNASQSNSSNQPTYVSEAINDFPAVAFNGSAQFLQLPPGFADFANGISIFMVLEPTGLTGDYARILDFGDNTDTISCVTLSEITSTSLLFTVGNAENDLTNVQSDDLVQEAYQLIEVIQSSSSVAALYTDGVQGAQNSWMNAIDNTTRVGNYIGRFTGGGYYFEGQIAELLVYNRALSNQERLALELYSYVRYGLSLPTPVAPLITVPSGSLSKPEQVAICGAYNGTVYYTVNGADPSSADTAYGAPLNVYYSQTIKAIQIVNGIPSGVSSASYTLDSTAYPAPEPSDTTPLTINVDLPTTAQ